jgi:1,4-dihydroxy-6-naphthoate synthase
MKLTLGFSPCPNDTFIFDALVNGKINSGDLEFDVVLEDVQTLNDWALQGKLDVTKLSYAVLPLVLQQYILLQSGSALGKGVGPLLISKELVSDALVRDQLIAIPGQHTTAHMLFKLKYPDAVNKVFLRYDEIENFVLEGKGLGVIIHENRFTYEAKGLKKITDLGDYWESHLKVPIPLGGITIKRTLPREIQLKVDALIKESIEFAYRQYPELTDYIRIHSQEMSEDVMRKHIDLYVNEYSIALGQEGKKAVKKLVDTAGNYAGDPEDIFVA